MATKIFDNNSFMHGLTLIELLLTVSLAAISLMIAIPAMQHMIVQNRVASQVQQITGAIQFARSEAIKRGVTVIFCKSKDLKTCGGSWRDGQIILAANNVLRVYQALPAGDELTWSSSFGKDDALEILATGFTNGQSGSFNYCPHDIRYAKRIVVNQSGRTRITNDGITCPS